MLGAGLDVDTQIYFPTGAGKLDWSEAWLTGYHTLSVKPRYWRITQKKHPLTCTKMPLTLRCFWEVSWLLRTFNFSELSAVCLLWVSHWPGSQESSSSPSLSGGEIVLVKMFWQEAQNPALKVLPVKNPFYHCFSFLNCGVFIFISTVFVLLKKLWLWRGNSVSKCESQSFVSYRCIQFTDIPFWQKWSPSKYQALNLSHF